MIGRSSEFVARSNVMPPPDSRPRCLQGWRYRHATTPSACRDTVATLSVRCMRNALSAYCISVRLTGVGIRWNSGSVRQSLGNIHGSAGSTSRVYRLPRNRHTHKDQIFQRMVNKFFNSLFSLRNLKYTSSQISQYGRHRESRIR